jgi:hypothetical protein
MLRQNKLVGLIRKYWTWLESPIKDKHSSLFVWFASEKEKKAMAGQCFKTFCLTL